MSKKKKGKEIWEVEKEFIQKITSQLSDISEQVETLAQETAKQRTQINRLKQNKESQHSERMSQDAIFRCTEVSLSDKPISGAKRERRMRPFRQKLKRLMRQYRVAQVGATFLSKLKSNPITKNENN